MNFLRSSPFMPLASTLQVFILDCWGPVKSADALVKQELLAALAAALEQLSPGAGAKAAFESPKVAAHGDFACTAAMQLAKPLKLNPRQLAERLRTALLAHRPFTSAGWRTSTSPAPASSTSG
jgi:predicted alpha/beta superfamily hydrolase